MGMLHAAAERLSTEVEEGHPGPVARAVFERFIERMLSGQITLCPHLSWTAPQPTAWLAYAPGRLRCVPCTSGPARRIKGTREDYRCDHCRQISRPIHSCIVQAPTVVVDLPGRLECLPPIAVHFGLCAACLRANR